MIIEFDKFNNYQIPLMTLCNPNTNQLGILDNIKNYVFRPTFNEVSKISFDIYKNYNNQACDMYDKIQSFRSILIEDIGYFVIIDAPEYIDNDNGEYKQVEAYSCEYELNNLQVNYLKGTYKFYDETDTENSTLLKLLLKSFPRWSIGYVDSDVADLYRTFDVPTSTIYEFLMQDVEDSYNCIFSFNILDRVVNVYNKDNYVHKTSVLLDRDDVIQHITIKPKDTEIVTALNVSGGNNLGINGVNPLGLSTIYNFKSYETTDWMSQNLLDKVHAWEQAISNREDDYMSILTSLQSKNNELNDIEVELYEIQTNINLNETIKTTILENDAGLSDEQVKEELNSVQNELNLQYESYSSKLTELDTKQAEIDTLVEQRNTINNELSFDENFTDDEYSELSVFIREGDYKEENITQTDSMTYEERQNQSLELYEQAKKVLDKICEMRYEFDIETNSFIFHKNFESFQTELATGNIITLELREDDFREHILLSMEVRYDDETISLTFGNRYKLHGSNNLLQDLSSSVSSSSNTITYERENWNYGVTDGKINEAYAFTQKALDLSKNAIMSANGQTVAVTDKGYIGRKVYSDGTVDDIEIRIANNQIMFLDNHTNTAKTAIGYMVLPNDEKKYGVNAEMLLGNIIIGNELTIENESGTFSVDKDGVTIAQYIKGTDLEKYIRFSEGEMQLGQDLPDEDGNIFQVDLTNEEMSFIQNGYVVAFINHNKLKTTEVEVGERLSIGKNGYFDFIPRENGNLSIKWRNE